MDTRVALLRARWWQCVLQEAVKRWSVQVECQLVGGAIRVHGTEDAFTQTGWGTFIHRQQRLSWNTCKWIQSLKTRKSGRGRKLKLPQRSAGWYWSISHLVPIQMTYGHSKKVFLKFWKFKNSSMISVFLRFTVPADRHVVQKRVVDRCFRVTHPNHHLLLHSHWAWDTQPSVRPGPRTTALLAVRQMDYTYCEISI